MERLVQGMNIAVGAIWLNRGRAVLTMLGIIIGIAAVVALVSLGRGVEVFVLNQFQALGSDILTVTSSEPLSDTRTRVDPLTLQEAERIAQRGSVAEVGADFNVAGMTIVANGESIVATAKGITPNVMELQSWALEEGQAINQAHINQRARVALLGSEVFNNLFPDAEPQAVVGQVLQTSNQIFEIIGVMEPGGTGVGDTDTSILIPISTAQSRLADARTNSGQQVSTIYIRAIDNDSAEITELEVHQVLQQAHGIATPDERDYTITNQSSLLDTITQITTILTVFLGAIASISLVVGGIGIMNIMLVTVTERTREIGLRKSVGAQPGDILMQFLLESLLLSLVGGVIGILVAFLITYLISSLIPDLVVQVQADAILLATVISSLVGIVFGLLPARQAAQLHPIDALRYE